MIGPVAAALDVSEEPGDRLRHLLPLDSVTNRTLLVVDNMEHVAAGAGEIAELLDACPGLQCWRPVGSHWGSRVNGSTPSGNWRRRTWQPYRHR